MMGFFSLFFFFCTEENGIAADMRQWMHLAD